jgi:hypothetical protein
MYASLFFGNAVNITRVSTDKYPEHDIARPLVKGFPSYRALKRWLALLPFLSLLLFLTSAAAGCKSSSNPRSDEDAAKKKAKKSAGEADDSSPGNIIARLEDDSIDESSGLAASRRNPDIFWTHNDSGDDPLLFAIDRQGRTRGVWRITDAKARDWEDIAVGPGPESGRTYVYVGDIGNNKYSREQLVIYRFPEPVVDTSSGRSSRRSPLNTEAAEAIRLAYPDGNHDAEALMVHPQSGDIYIATKTTDPSTVIYKLSGADSYTDVNRLTRVGEVRIPNLFGALITGADISPDGRRVIFCDYTRAYELRMADGATVGQGFDTIWGQALVSVPLGKREQGEAVCYRLDGAAILATSEGRHAPLIEYVFPRAP